MLTSYISVVGSFSIKDFSKKNRNPIKFFRLNCYIFHEIRSHSKLLTNNKYIIILTKK